MFEILKALMALQHACEKHATDLRWHVQHDEPGYPVLMAEIPLTVKDQEFVQGMEAMFALRVEGR